MNRLQLVRKLEDMFPHKNIWKNPDTNQLEDFIEECKREAIKPYQWMETELRNIWWQSHFDKAKHNLYGDDGERQCNTCLIDFKREDIVKLRERQANFMLLLTSKNSSIHFSKDRVEEDFPSSYWRQQIL